MKKRSRRRRFRHEDRVLLEVLLAAAPAAAIALALVWAGPFRLQVQWTLTVILGVAVLAFAHAARQRVIHSLQTVSNLLSALRESDFSMRGRSARIDDTLGQVMTEINSLADTLRGQDLGAAETSALLAKLIEETDLAIFAFDAGRRLRLVNRAGCELLAQRRERLIGRDAADLGLTDLLDLDAPRTIALPQGGSRGPWELRRTPFRERGRPHTLVVLSDVSRTLRAEERQAWQRLVRVLSHEINNSLAPISSIAGILRQTLRADENPPAWGEDAARGLEVIERRADSLARFMTAYARLARLPPPDRGRVEVGPWVRRVADLEKRASVSVAAGPDDAVVAGDGAQLEQLLINLVNNAVDAARETGGAVAVGWGVRGGVVEIRVTDEGLGLADTTNLFVPFFTTKPEGSGIGLALSRQIADAHRGSLVLENRRDRTGCEARLTLPLAGPEPEARADADPFPPAGSGVPQTHRSVWPREGIHRDGGGPADARSQRNR
ncbi:MAG TPA: ATP-binding protein [Kofleriaceae bacterium]|nr:ATP-binding protein [Kofleriaceae bacterium]